MKYFFSLFLLFLSITISSTPQAKYVFLFIGDGMGANQILMTEMYRAESQNKKGRIPLVFTGFPFTGFVTTYSESNSITDSSAASTAIATGTKTNNHVVGIDAKGNALTSIAAELHQQGWPIGIATTVPIHHATPAGFFAHSTDRNAHYSIGSQLASSEYDFFAGSAFLQPDTELEADNINLYDLCKKNGYTFACSYQDYLAKRDDADKLILLDARSGLDKHARGKRAIPFAIDQDTANLTMKQIAIAAIDFLSKNDRFFLMMEGGSIDYACHDNDAATVCLEIEAFNDAIQVAYDFYLEHPDETLIIVTADHETGGLGLGTNNCNYQLNLDILNHQKISVKNLTDSIFALQEQYGSKLQFEHLKGLLSRTTGLYSSILLDEKEDKELVTAFYRLKKHEQKSTKTLYSDLTEISTLAIGMIDQRAHIGWTTHSHTAAAVPIYTIGAGGFRFIGTYENTRISTLIRRATSERKSDAPNTHDEQQ